MNRIFRHLSEDEERGLLEDGGLCHFEPEAVIIQEGDPHTGIFVVHKGHVRVEKDSAGFPLELSRLGPGEIFGEMSFVEGAAASASVVADQEPVALFRVAEAQLEPLLDSAPGLYGRFYKSLAEILSGRLRATSTVMATPEWSPRGFAVPENEETPAWRPAPPSQT